MKRFLSYTLLIMLLAIPALHKSAGDLPPEWFVSKFSSSFLGSIPFGITGSYLLIVLLEWMAPLLFIWALIRGEFKGGNKRFTQWALDITYLLFVILTFGSLLVEDYGNAFKDFIYFVGVVVLDRFVLMSEKTA